MTARPLYVIGECPPITLAEYAARGLRHEPLFPLPTNSAGGRLFRFSNYGLGLYVRGLRRANLLPDSPGKSWPTAMARGQACQWTSLLQREGAIAILFGRKVADAFGIAGEWFSEHQWGTSTLITVPHTSGRSTNYNDPAIVARLEQVFASVKPHAEAQLAAWHAEGRGGSSRGAETWSTWPSSSSGSTQPSP